MAGCQVETYSGSRLHEQPRRFARHGVWLEVRQVLDRWRDPEHLFFKVLADDNQTYLLVYHHLRDLWEVRPTEV
jgi:hypothetical protein